jgi:hypothetical protein
MDWARRGLGIVILLAVALLAGCSARAPLAREEAASAPAPEPAAAPDAGIDEYAAAVAQGGEATDAAAPLARKVIATARISLVVSDTAVTVDAIDALMDEMGGYVSNSNLSRYAYDSGTQLQGSLTLRVPAGQLDETLDRLAGLAVDVPSRSTDRQDITDQYSDVDAQIRNLEAAEVELREMLAEIRARPGATAEDIMTVYRQLTDIRSQIEERKGRKNMWDNLIALSTIEISLAPSPANRPVIEEGWQPAVVLRDATRTLINALQFLGSAAIWIGVFLLPLLVLAAIPLVVLFYVLRWLFRRLSRKAPQPAA